MPFASRAQQGFMFAHKPKMARQWAAETPNTQDLPEHVQKKARSAALQKIMRQSISH